MQKASAAEYSAPEQRPGWHQTVFFGLHYDLHANAKDTALGAALTYESLMATLAKIRPDWVQCDCKGHPGYTSWPTEVGSTSPGVVRDALRIHRQVTRDLGIPLVMHYSGVIDVRAIELHPEWARIGPNGEVAGTGGSLGSTCNLSPYTEELMIPHMLEIIEKYDIDGFWVDGENWGTQACYCPCCRKAFVAETGISDIPQSAKDAHWLEWANFHRRNFEEHVRKYTEAVHARKPDCLVCSNWMYTLGQPDPVRVPVDYLSGDFTWVWSTDKAIMEGRYMDSYGLPWNLMAWGFTTAEPQMVGWTFKPTAHLCQEAATVISLGGALQIYETPQRDGHLTGWHHDILADVASFVRARQPWCQGTESVPQVALLHAASHIYPNLAETLMSLDGRGAHLPMMGALHALLENHCHVDILNEEMLCERAGRYPLVVAAEQTHLPDPVKQALTAYVRAGGKLLLSGINVASDFPELAGVTPGGDPLDEYRHLAVGRETTTVKGPWQPVIPAGARVVLNTLQQQDPQYNHTDIPAVTMHSVGKGAVLAIHGQLFTHFASSHYPRTRKLVGELLQQLRPEFLVEMDAQARLHVVLRRQADRLIVHLVNMGTAHPTSPHQILIEEVPPVGPVCMRVQVPKHPTRVYLAPSMEGVQWEWCDGLLTVRIATVGIMDSLVIEESNV